jgi:AcrR family transcriptional regulator
VSSRTTHGAARSAKTTGSGDATPTREVILDTAERLFAERGVDGVAVRDLARVMNLTAPSLYNHFPSKQALYEAVLERGIAPIVRLVAEAWQPGALRPDRIELTIDDLVSHLAKHPHLARLLQRALLEETGSVQDILARWFDPLYRQGFAVIRETAGEAGWERNELPHVALGLFGLVFAYFTYLKTLEAIAPNGNPLAPQTLRVQRRFLQKAIFRLLGPQASEGRPRKHSGTTRESPQRQGATRP